MVKNLPAMQETLVRFLGWEDPLEKGKATNFSILAWRIPWTVQLQRVRYDWATFTSHHFTSLLHFNLHLTSIYLCSLVIFNDVYCFIYTLTRNTFSLTVTTYIRKQSKNKLSLIIPISAETNIISILIHVLQVSTYYFSNWCKTNILC